LKGLSTGDFGSALTALLGQDAPGLSAATISRLKEVWREEYEFHRGKPAVKDYLKYYALERFLFEEVHQRFHADHSLGAFDFFSIVIWKANRAKSRIARKLLTRDAAGRHNLEAISRTLTAALYNAPNHKERLRLLIKEWDFALPMASAILSVCWPEDFTVYDYRVRQRLAGFPELNNLTDFEKIWKGFNEYKAKSISVVTTEAKFAR
jgi:hypothetical protein